MMSPTTSSEFERIFTVRQVGLNHDLGAAQGG